MKKEILVVGGGFSGACYARVLAEAGRNVHVIDRRNHLGGNAYDYVEDGIRRHKYGPHLFHTNIAEVAAWVSSFAEWIPYEHRVRGRLPTGQCVPVPINLDTVNAVFNQSFHGEEEVRLFLDKICIPNENPQNAAEYLNSKIGEDLTNIFFRGYTRKMWELDLEDISVSVVKRIPISFNKEDRYFPNDAFQALPKNGYADLFDKIFSHPNITVSLSTNFSAMAEVDFEHIFTSMPIDEYFGFCLGELPYRSIKFYEKKSTTRSDNQWATTNFLDDTAYTRETAWHVLPMHIVKECSVFVYTSEKPCDYRVNNMERYYPVKTADNRYDELYKLYYALAEKTPKVTFIGRCGMYMYLDMHQVINQSLKGARAWVLANPI